MLHNTNMLHNTIMLQLHNHQTGQHPSQFDVDDDGFLFRHPLVPLDRRPRRWPIIGTNNTPL